MNGFRQRIFVWWDSVQPRAIFMVRLLMIMAVAALPVILGIRAVYYNFVIYDESALSIEIANEVWMVSVFVSPLFSVLGKYMLSGLRKDYPEGKASRVSCSVIDWVLNVQLIIAGIRVACAVVYKVCSLLLC